MKLLTLTIHNLASIEDATIDFSAPPLVDNGLFLITGKTGSGKSTILDAICLCLFATTPRMSTAKKNRDKDKLTEESVETAPNDPRQLLRQQTGEGFASLKFEGNDKKEYEAKWSVYRSRNKIDGALQQKKWELKNLETGTILTKDNEIKPEIQRIVGLDFNQFSRTTVLAQGEFSRFLKSEDNEKAGILEKITGREEYAKIGRAVFEITKEKENDYFLAEEKKGNLNPLSDEIISLRQEEMAGIDEKSKNLKTRIDSEKNRKKWIEDKEKLSTAVAGKKAELEKLQMKIDSEETKKKREEVSGWKNTVEVRQIMSSIKEKKKKISREEEKLSTLGKEFITAREGINFLKKSILQIEKEKERIEDYIAGQKPREGMYSNCGRLTDEIKDYTGLEKNFKKKSGVLEVMTENYNKKLLPSLGIWKEKRDKNRAANQVVAKKIKDAEQELLKYDMPLLRSQQTDMDKRDIAIRTIIDKINLWLSKISSLKLNKRQNIENESRLAALKEKLTLITASEEETEKELAEKERVYKLQRDSINKLIIDLRGHLHVGDICPVCRFRIEKPLISEEEIDKYVEEAKNDYENARRVHDKLTKELNELKIEYKTLEQTIKDSRARNEQEEKLLDEEQNNLRIELKKIVNKDFLQIEDEVLPVLDRKKELLVKEISGLKKKIEEGEKREVILKDLRKESETLSNEFDTIDKELRAAETLVNDKERELEKLNGLIQQDRNYMEVSKIRLKELAGDALTPEAMADLNKFGKQLEKDSAEYYNNIEKVQALDSQKMNLKMQLATVDEPVRQILSIIPLPESTQTTEEREVKNLSDRLNTLLKNISSSLSLVESSRETVDVSEKRIEEWLLDNTGVSREKLEYINSLTPDNIKQWETELSELDRNLIMKETELSTTARNLEQLLQEQPEFKEGEDIESITAGIQSDELALDELLQRKGAIEKELATDREVKMKMAELIEEIKKKKEEYDSWSELNKLIGDSQGHKFRRIAQSYVLACLAEAANHYLKTLVPRYSLIVEPNSFLIIIRDSWRSDSHRFPSTLSGGETFLVSLALALALSDIGEKLTVDTLFIDEGFGSLSGEPLRQSIETLRNLHLHSGRHIGVISHVEELRERINVRINVEQENKSSSSRISVSAD